MLTTEAFHEAIKRYPNAVEALVWFATASGLLTQVIEQKHLDWANQIIDDKIIIPESN